MKKIAPPRQLARRTMAVAALAFMPIMAQAEARTSPPLPTPRPEPVIGKSVDLATTASILPRPNPLQNSDLTGVDDISELKSGLDALAAGNIDQARSIRHALPESSLDRHILAWAVALGGGDKVPNSEITQTARLLPDWPGLITLRRNSERALFREQPDAAAVIAAFAATPPLTVEGTILLARAYVTIGQPDKARQVISPFWRTAKLEAADEASVIKEFGKLIPVADHRQRMEKMLYLNRVASAQRVAGLTNAPELGAAWAATIRGDQNARNLLDKVPQAQRSAGWYFATVKDLRRAGQLAEAANVMLKAPRDKDSLVDPDAWWVERRTLSRELVDADDMKNAYRVVAAHSAESPANAADAEFHAGWYALRGLSDPATAAKHFKRITEFASGPISLSRAYYWLGRAAETGGPSGAQAYFEKASAYGTTFYGQLAAARLGRHAISMTYPAATASDRRIFSSREAVRAIRRLELAGYPVHADILYRNLAEQLTSPGELALLAVMAEERDNHFLSLRIGKIAAARGIDIGALSHPLGAIPGSTNVAGAGKALAYAVARQESEFNVGAVSSAGARGLLQLLPTTAKEVAKRNGLPYSQARLTTDAAYNATLGSAFLSEQLGRFNGSYVLTFAGYNAGPRRAQQWIDRYGDPRGKDIDSVVDWIERIPFAETRSYVQRVMENYQVYKMRLSGSFDIVSDLVDGR